MDSIKRSKEKILDLLNESYPLRISNLKKSTSLAKDALSISRKIDNKDLIGKSLNMLSLYYMIQGQHQESLSMAEEAILHFKELNNEIGIADAKYNIASINYKTDNYHLGLINLIDCLAIYRKHEDYHNQARTLKSLGTIYEYFLDTKNASKSYKSSVEMAKIAGDKNLESNAYNPLSGMYLDEGDFEQAKELIEKSINMKQETGDLRGMAFALYGRAKIYAKLGQVELAINDYEESIRIHLEMNERIGVGMAYYKLGNLYLDLNNLKKAREVISLGIKSSEKYNVVMVQFKCYNLMYQISKSENNISEALNYLELYIKTRERVINTQTSKIIENYDLIKQMEILERETQIQKERSEIIEKTNKAEHSAKAKQEFLSTVSHEIRTPLNAIISIAHLLEDTSTPEQVDLISALGFASNNLLQIVNDILDYSKLEANKMVLNPNTTNIQELFVSIRDTYVNLAADKGINLLLKIGNSVNPSYLIDDSKLTQIMNNLITNAIKYSEKGFITISVDKVNEVAEIDHLKISVKDTGMGIAPKYFVDIFESFNQPKSITTKTHSGTGLGLAIVKKLVELMNSKIEFTSEENVGSDFFFTLALKPTIKKNERSISPQTKLIGKSILIVDDNMINALVASKLLMKWGLKTEHAENGKDAIIKTNKNKYDFILMDIHMPLMDGYESCSRIRKSNGLNKYTPIYALTADVTAAEHPEFDLNFNGILIKPINILKLYECLTKLII